MAANILKVDIEPVSVKQLFSVPVFVFSVRNSDQLNNELREAVSELRSIDRGVRVSNQGGYHSKKNMFEHPWDALGKLKGVISQSYGKVRKQLYHLDNTMLDELRIEGWVNVNLSGDSNALHEHLGSGCHWSGVYYVQMPQESHGCGRIVFEDLIYKDFGTGFQQIWRVPSPDRDLPELAHEIPHLPQEGQIIFFPSSINHRVEEFRRDGERISIAFNIMDPSLSYKRDRSNPLQFDGLKSWVKYYFYGLYHPVVRVKRLLTGNGGY